MLAAAAALAVGCSLIVPGTVANAGLAPGTPPTNGLQGVELTPSAGTGTTPFALQFNPGNQACPGDATTGYNWSTFVTPTTSDPALLTFDGTGEPQGPAITTALRRPDTSSIVGELPTPGSFLLDAPAQAQFGPSPLSPGDYYIGIACTRLNALSGVVENEGFWATRIVVTDSGAGTYDWSVVASPPPICPAPVVSALDVFAGDVVIVNWAAPTPCGETPVSYDVDILSGVSTVVSQAGVNASTSTVTGLGAGSYTARVTPNFAAGSGISAPPGTDTLNVSETGLAAGEITVTRPPGALVLTQRCGVSNALPAYPAVDAFPGFPIDLAAVAATVERVGTAPIGDPISDDPDLGIIPDPEFANYPLPITPTYPTECGVSMGTAELATGGALAGQFFAAHGRLNEVTVVDIRDDDAGWMVRGDIEGRFTGPSGDSFSGDYLGWQPIVTGDSGPVGGEGPGGTGPLYDQSVIAGPSVLPGTGFSTAAAGLTDNPMLARAQAGRGLGIATLDARLALLIPTWVDASDYTARLTITAV